MVSATEMAKAFPDKNLTNIINSVEIQEYIQEVSKLQNYSLADLLVVVRGGSNPGTWIHKKLILRIAQKLSPKFSVWVDERIEELLKYGLTATPNTIEELLANPDTLIKTLEALKTERAEKEKLQKQLNIQSAKIEFIDRVLDTEEKIDVGQCAKILELPFGRNTLFKKLREQGVFFKSKNEPKQIYVEKGYFQLKEKWINRTEHESFMVLKVLVTQRGVGFLSTLFKSEPQSKINVQLN